MKGLVSVPISLLQLPILTRVARRMLRESGSRMPLDWQGSGTRLGTLPWKIGVLSRRIRSEPLGIWWGWCRGESERVLIQSVWRNEIAGFSLVRTRVGSPFGTCILIGSIQEAGSSWVHFFVFLWISGYICSHPFVFTVTSLIECACSCFPASCVLVLILLEVKYCCYTHYWVSGFDITVLYRYFNAWHPSFWKAGSSWTCSKESRPAGSRLPE